jgi:hypothetical protein
MAPSHTNNSSDLGKSKNSLGERNIQHRKPKRVRHQKAMPNSDGAIHYQIALLLQMTTSLRLLLPH